jgi:hypothetical protein
MMSSDPVGSIKSPARRWRPQLISFRFSGWAGFESHAGVLIEELPTKPLDKFQ